MKRRVIKLPKTPDINIRYPIVIYNILDITTMSVVIMTGLTEKETCINTAGNIADIKHIANACPYNEDQHRSSNTSGIEVVFILTE